MNNIYLSIVAASRNDNHGNNLDEIYSNLQEILSENKFKEYGKAAKDFAQSFTWDKIIKQYNSIIN